jgi:hypothetical protein
MKRAIPSAPPYQISKDGTVYLNGKRIPPEVRPGLYQDRLTVRIGDFWWPVEGIISEVWYTGSPLLIPRNGVAIDFTEGNIFPLLKWPKAFEISREKILWTWTQYQFDNVPVNRLAEATGFSHWSSQQFYELIAAILIAGIRK